MDKRKIIGLSAAALLALAALLVWLIPAGFGMSALTLLFAAAAVSFYTLCAGRKRLIIAVSILLFICLCLFMAAEVQVIAGMSSDPDSNTDALIVMGAGINGTSPSLSMLDRLNAAYSWLLAHPEADVIVSGSQAPDEAASEAAVMARWLEEQGIDPERIILEERADSTAENILNSFTLAALHGKSSVTVVSSEYHLCRIRLICRALGFDAACIAGRSSRPSMLINFSIREAFALWQIWVFGISTT